MINIKFEKQNLPKFQISKINNYVFTTTIQAKDIYHCIKYIITKYHVENASIQEQEINHKLTTYKKSYYLDGIYITDILNEIIDPIIN